MSQSSIENQKSKINHLAIAVSSIDAALSFYRDALGLDLQGVDAVEHEGVKVAFLPLGESHIELVEPTRNDTGIAKWMSKHGQGLHHLCIEVHDIDAMLKRLAARGVVLINPQAVTRDNGTRYAFIHPRSAFGVLVELYEL
jgi:methylmalonyl-CoA/ethylmalonyl-CoA epimerase